MSSEDEFMEIVQNGDLGDITENDLYVMQIKDLHQGLKDIAQATAIITEFIYDFFSSWNDGEEEYPSLTANAIIHAKDMFVAAEKFCEEFFDNEFDDDDDEYDDEDDDDGDDDE